MKTIYIVKYPARTVSGFETVLSDKVFLSEDLAGQESSRFEDSWVEPYSLVETLTENDRYKMFWNAVSDGGYDMRERIQFGGPCCEKDLDKDGVCPVHTTKVGP